MSLWKQEWECMCWRGKGIFSKANTLQSGQAKWWNWRRKIQHGAEDETCSSRHLQHLSDLGTILTLAIIFVQIIEALGFLLLLLCLEQSIKLDFIITFCQDLPSIGLIHSCVFCLTLMALPNKTICAEFVN
jgi:hypothetical protein